MLERLRRKPDHVKKGIALSATIGFFSLILLVWLSSWDARMSSDETRNTAVTPASGLLSMLRGVTEDLKTSYSSVTSYDENPSWSRGGKTASATTTATTSSFNMAGVVIIDTSASTTPSHE